MAMKTAIVIVNWNTKDLTLACLDAVAAHAPGREVWLVDNASTDGSQDAIAAAHLGVKLIRNAENVGFARANNQAIAESEADYVWLLNSDTEMAPGALDALEAYLDAHPRVAAVGSALVNPDGSPQACSFAFATPLATWAEWLYLPGPLARGRDRAFALAPRRERGRTDWVLGASMLVRRSAIAEVGLLDEGYFMYSEEMDWCRRFASAGWEVHLETESVVMHHGGGSTRRMPDKMLIELFKSRARYFRRHLPWTRRAAYVPLMAAGAAWNTLYVLAGRVPGAKVATQWAIARTGLRA
jgi:GT2 family glycosyltransferase